MPTQTRQAVSDTEFRALCEFRQHIQRYLEYSDHAAKDQGIEPRQYQLMLYIKGMPQKENPTVGTLARRLNIRHHSAVELIDRAVRNGLVRRSARSGGQVLVQLTPNGYRILERAVADRLKELQTAGPALVSALGLMLRPKRRARKTS